MGMLRGLPTTARRRLKFIRQGGAAILQGASQIRRVFGERFGTVWNRCGIDRRKKAVWVPRVTSYGTEPTAT